MTCRALHRVAASYPQKGIHGTSKCGPMDGMGIVEKRNPTIFTILHGEIQEDKTCVSHSVGCPFCGNKTRLVHGSWVGGRLHKVVLLLKMPEKSQ